MSVNNMSGSTGQNSQYLPPMGIGQPGSVIGGVQSLTFRDGLDAQRSGMSDFVPSAEYPDGYLGTIQSRREDRFLDKLKEQVGAKSYTRGVHKGEKIDARDYFWPPEFDPQSGLQRQSMVVQNPVDGTWMSRRAAPIGTVQEQMMADTGRLPMTPQGRLRPPPDVYQKAQTNIPGASLKSLAPSWR